jgi:hypothetical protein
VAPFDGVTCAAVVSLSITRVRQALEILVDALEAEHADVALLKLSDWHFAGGALTTARAVSWRELRYWLRSDNGVFQARAGDEDVCIAVYPHSREFVLRFYVDPEVRAPGEPLEGRFDVTARAEISSILRESLHRGGISEFETFPASEFFALDDGPSRR